MKRSVRVMMGILFLCAATGAQANIEMLEKTGNAFAGIAAEALPAVVFVNVQTTVEVPQYGYRYFDPFEHLFGRGRGRGFAIPEELEPKKYSQRGQGSGFIISKDGYILTNNHVVNDADEIMVTLADGRKFEAAVIGTDPKTEVALIKIEDGNDFPYLKLGDSDALRVGEWVLAAGSPFGLSQTVTAGIVSAKERDQTGIAEYGNFIQTDAAINPGNSGGPLLNIKGEVIGINTAIYSRSGGYMGIGFAIPINMAAQIKDQLIEHGRVSRSVLGIVIQEVDEDLAASFGLDDTKGILIAQTMPGSAAEKAGLEPGDVIVEMNGKKVGKLSRFRHRVAATPPQSEVILKVFRDGEYREIEAVTQAMDEGGTVANDPDEPALQEKLGLSVEEHDGESGIIVSHVEQGTPAWRAGLKPGQLILSVNRKAVDSVGDFNRELAKIGEGHRALFLVSDGRSSRFIVVTPD